jgi:omega-6 fatty acid desaturase (delta-12 desaturase)
MSHVMPPSAPVRSPRVAALRPADPPVKQVRDVLPAHARERSTRRGVACFVGAVVPWLVTFLAIGLPMPWPARVAFAVVNGLACGLLFVVGHDACHGSLTPRSRLNACLGRAALLPSLHPYVAWAHSHNALHHGWTNLRGRDPVYAPMTLAEFRALPSWRRGLVRACRSALGVLPLYLLEIWWRYEIRPSPDVRAHVEKRGSFVRDRALVLAMPPVQAAALALLAHVTGAAAGWALVGVAALGATVPFLTFTWMMGFATFQHHTHPRVVWYADEREWSFYRSQVQGTVHVELPAWVDALLHHIMEHTAHHVDTRVPLYQLAGAQRAIEAAFGPDVIVERFTLRGMRRTFRACQLYDYEAHRWLSFDGVPTTEARDLEAERRARMENASGVAV